MLDELRTQNQNLPKAQVISIGLHVACLTLLLIPFATRMGVHFPVPPVWIGPPADFTEPPAEFLRKIAGKMGGGQREAGEATRGLAPLKASMQIVPPGHYRNPNAPLQLIPTVVAPPELEFPKIAADRWGDPYAKLFTDSGGPGGPNGFGPGNGNTIGDEKQQGVGWPHTPAHAGYMDPSCNYCPNPSFTDEAIKTKFQGTVVLRVLVSAEGRAERIQLTKAVGMGLDERAVETVRTWRFRPGRAPNGAAVRSTILIEVTFRQF